MNSYSAEDGYDGDWDLGYRATIGFENPSGLFAQVTGFLYSGDFDTNNPNQDGEVDFYTVDLLIGDSIHCSELCVSIAGGLRYGGFEADTELGPRDGIEYEFDGWGPVVEIAAERKLTEQFSLYAELRQSILFGEDEWTQKAQNFTEKTDTIAAITEIGAGVQVNFALGNINAHARAGFEGQYWHVDDSDHGLFGGVFSVGANF